MIMSELHMFCLKCKYLSLVKLKSALLNQNVSVSLGQWTTDQLRPPGRWFQNYLGWRSAWCHS